MVLRKPAVAAPSGVDFGSLGMYVSGGGLPDGNYIWINLDVMEYQAEDKNTGAKKGASRLGVMITMLPLDDPKPENERTQFYSMGSSANKSFAPNPETGKGIVLIPGGAGVTLNNSTNWALLLKSLHDCGLPDGVFTNDVSVLEGVHVHMTNVPEPEERKGYKNTAATGEAAVEERRAGTVAIVSEIKDDGKPWEGSGGVPTAKATRAAVAKPVAGKAAAKPAAKPAAAPEADGDAIMTAAINGISAVLEKNPNGCAKLLLRTGTFNAIKTAEGDDMASAVIESFFGNDAALNDLLGQLGFGITGGAVKPV